MMILVLMMTTMMMTLLYYPSFASSSRSHSITVVADVFADWSTHTLPPTSRCVCVCACMCVCVCACVRARARVCVYLCVCHTLPTHSELYIGQRGCLSSVILTNVEGLFVCVRALLHARSPPPLPSPTPQAFPPKPSPVSSPSLRPLHPQPGWFMPRPAG